MASYRKIFRCASAKAQIFSQKHSKRNQLPPKNGLPMEEVPKDFPPYNLVYYYFSKWKNEGVFDEVHQNVGKQH